MTTTNDTDTALARIDRELAALPDEAEFAAQLRANRQEREQLEARRMTIQRATAQLATLDAKLAAEQRWHDDLTAWRTTLCTELLAFPRRVSGVELGKRQNLEWGISTIDRGIHAHGQFTLDTSRLGQLMREAGYQPSEPPDLTRNFHGGPLPWFGALPEVERRLAGLQRQRDDLRRVLADALLDPADLAAKDRTLADAARAQGTLKTRGDGSTYRKFSDGRIEDVSEPPSVGEAVGQPATS